MTRLLLTLALLLALPAQATINAVSSQHIILVGADGGRYSQYPAGDKPLDAVTRKVYFTGGFETVPGAVQASTNINDGFNTQTTPTTQTGCEFTSFKTGGNAVGGGMDSFVAPSGTAVGSGTPTARNGNYFYKIALVYTRDYRGINGDASCTNDAADKPRSGLYLAEPGHRLNFDSEVWLGFSVYIPPDWEPETGVTGNRSGPVVVSIFNNSNVFGTLLSLGLWTMKGESTTSWAMVTYTSDTTVKKSTDNQILPMPVLGNTVTDKDVGKWTDFIIHFRVNPFTTTTNASTISGGENFSYGGNRGILQIWKSTGEATPRAMSLVYDVHDAPVGLVPKSGEKLMVMPEAYNYGWKHNATTRTHSVELGFDDIRFGCVNNAANGVSVTPCVQRAIDVGSTGFADVNPEGTAAP